MVTVAGGTVEHAADGVEALQKLADSAFDIVFMDIAMPRMDGIAATIALRKLGNNVTVVAVTANYEVSDAYKLTALGFDGLIPKPIDMVGVFGWVIRMAEVDFPID